MRGARTLKWTAIGTLDRYIKVPEVVVVWCSGDAWRGVRDEAFCLLKVQSMGKDMAGRHNELCVSGRVGGLKRAP